MNHTALQTELEKGGHKLDSGQVLKVPHPCFSSTSAPTDQTFFFCFLFSTASQIALFYFLLC